MPFYYDPSPEPSERSQAQAALYQAMDARAEVQHDPAASAEELADMNHAYQTARGWFSQAVRREAETEPEAG